MTGLTSLTKDICREAFENAEPLAPHETEELFTISHEQVGLLYGADLARISEAVSYTHLVLLHSAWRSALNLDVPMRAVSP